MPDALKKAGQEKKILVSMYYYVGQKRLVNFLNRNDCFNWEISELSWNLDLNLSSNFSLVKCLSAQKNSMTMIHSTLTKKCLR